jgi:sigma-B regulation protein RsbU (phosphoserine phosphatase)
MRLRSIVFRRALAAGMAAALGGYMLAAALEAAVIGWLKPTELQTELSLAADIQRRLLPQVPPSSNGCEWAAALRPAGQVGGDFYDFVETGPGVWTVLVADVSGKGIPAAMPLGSVRSTFRALSRQGLGPAELVTQLSQTFLRDWQGTPYLTCLVAGFNLPARTLVYTNAGHPPGFLFGAAGPQRLDRGGPPAGLLADAVYEEAFLRIDRGDTCVLVSDGVTEAGVSLERFGSPHLGETAAADICARVMAAALAGRGPSDQLNWDDDRSVVVVAVREDAADERQLIKRSSHDHVRAVKWSEVI